MIPFLSHGHKIFVSRWKFTFDMMSMILVALTEWALGNVPESNDFLNRWWRVVYHKNNIWNFNRSYILLHNERWTSTHSRSIKCDPYMGRYQTSQWY